MSHPDPRRDYADEKKLEDARDIRQEQDNRSKEAGFRQASDKQLACIWEHFLFLAGQDKLKAKSDLCEYFQVEDIYEVSSQQAWQYMGNKIRQQDRKSVGFFEMQALEKDWK